MFFFEEITMWHWWTLGIIFLIFELMLPGACFLWLGISAAIIGIITALIPTLSLVYQLLLFSGISVASIIVYLRYKTQDSSSDSILNKRAKHYIGQIFTLENALKNGQGKIQLGDTIWTIRGPSCDKGAKVKVVSTEGSILNVEIL
ncbi:MAG: NfeD family protein [Candidatus Paracaedimonas acanthamoebae]|uniref:NfeD family protein n=1 Tax=Candidatus Paracaedimonas acanthamoebae TaxID=244581 RepID=A0A8J7TT31_9PROT|nr:NfeD family protein [Candidatus Paracaedimonas acanthamoebae]